MILPSSDLSSLGEELGTNYMEVLAQLLEVINMEAFPPGSRGTVAVISEQCHRTKGHRKPGLERGQQFRERVKDGTPFIGMNGLSAILCWLEVRVIPHTFMLPRHSLSDHVVEALCLHILQLIKTVGKSPGEEKCILPLSLGKRLLLKSLGDLSLA